MSPIKFVLLAVAMCTAQFFVSILAIKIAKVDKPSGILTFYGGDIYYVDTEKLHVGSESGKHDVQFKSFDQMSRWLEEVSADESSEVLSLELGIAMGQCSATILPDRSGVILKTYNFYTRDTVRMMLDSSTNGKTFYSNE